MPLYHVWFATKRRKWLLQGEVADIAERAFWDVARRDSIRLLECKTVIDHTHLLLGVEGEEELPAVMKALKGKSAHQVFKALPELKSDAQTMHLWQRGYGWKHVAPEAEATVRHYIRTQHDRLEKFVR